MEQDVAMEMLKPDIYNFLILPANKTTSL